MEYCPSEIYSYVDMHGAVIGNVLRHTFMVYIYFHGNNEMKRSPKHSSRVKVGLQLPLGIGMMKRGHGNSWGQQDLCSFVTQYLPSSDMVPLYCYSRPRPEKGLLHHFKGFLYKTGEKRTNSSYSKSSLRCCLSFNDDVSANGIAIRVRLMQN
ncbi:hypothetical protein NC651_015712 [Populus alba x Populus x berolinensis]|nr:hypothetical protein NC651_015712 [Populus alba x Populus x berolinensis]